MTYKAILAIADGGANTEVTLRMAVAMARAFGAHLDVLHVRADPESIVPVVGEGMSGIMVEQLITAMTQTIEARAGKARDAYQKVCAGAGAETVWREITGREPEIVAAAGRVCDLIIIGRPGAESDTPLAATLDAALFDTGRPVLVVPAGAPAAMGKRVLLAWNGSAQAARVVAGALPLLQSAEMVHIVTIGGIGPHATANELLAYLRHHGVKAAHESLETGHEAIGAGLLRQAGVVQAEMIVMGAYGHSRLREMILGGATRHVLASSNLPILMAH